MSNPRDIAAGLSQAEGAALCGRFEFQSLVEQEIGEANLYRLGVWKSGYLKHREKILTPLGLQVRAALEKEMGE